MSYRVVVSEAVQQLTYSLKQIYLSHSNFYDHLHIQTKSMSLYTMLCKNLKWKKISIIVIISKLNYIIIIQPYISIQNNNNIHTNLTHLEYLNSLNYHCYYRLCIISSFKYYSLNLYLIKKYTT